MIPRSQPREILIACALSLLVACYFGTMYVTTELSIRHYEHGAQLISSSNYNNAKIELKYSIRLNPDFAPAHNLLGVAYCHTGRLEEASSEFHEAIRLLPDFISAHYYFGVVLKKQGKIGDAKLQLERVIDLDESGGWAQIARQELEHLH